MIRAELEQSLKVNNHIEQSKSLYFGLIGSMISQASPYNPPLHKRKNFVANLGKLLSTIRGKSAFFTSLAFLGHILSKSDESIELIKQIISWLGVDSQTLTPFHQVRSKTLLPPVVSTMVFCSIFPKSQLIDL